MSSVKRDARAFGPMVGLAFVLLTAVTLAQQGPVATMFNADQQRDAALAQSFLPIDLPATGTATAPLKVYLSAGDLERAFDTRQFRPDAAVVPTNTDLQLKAASPATQQVLVGRAQNLSAIMTDLESQIAARRGQPSTATRGEPGLLRVGIDTLVVRLTPAAGVTTEVPLPKSACLIATDFAEGGAVDRRELFAQDRVRQGVAACLSALDAGGAQSIVLPLMGAGSSKTQTNDAMYEGQRTLKECRLLNSTAGIALGIHDFAARRRNVHEIGVIQWDQEVAGMFKSTPGTSAARVAQLAYRAYSDQVKGALRRGLNGQKTTAADLQGSCSGILNVQ